MCNHDRYFVEGACSVNVGGVGTFHKMEFGWETRGEGGWIGEKEKRRENGDGKGSTLAGWTTTDLESRSGTEEFEFGVGSLERKGVAWVTA